MAEFHSLNFSILTWCHTEASGALMTVDSTTEVDVGIDILMVIVFVFLGLVRFMIE